LQRVFEKARASGAAETSLLYVIDRSGKIAVFLVAENCLLREALARILNRKSDISVVGATAYSATVVQEMVAVSPQVLLFDPFPKVFSGLPFIAALRKSIAGLRVVMIGMDPDKDLFFRCVRGGIAGYLLRDATANEVLAAVRGVVKSEAVCPPHLCQALFDYIAQERASFPNFLLKQQLGLTRREQQLVQMISGGFTNKEIAVKLGLSEQTVKNHVHRMLRKLGAGDRLAVVEVCRTHGLLPA